MAQEETKEQQKLVTRTPDGYFLKKNIEHLPPDLIEKLKSVEHVTTPIDPDIIITGVKNPLYMSIIGFSTRKLIDSLKRKKKRIDNFLIIEPRLEVFKEVLMTEDISDLLVNPRIDFVIGIPPEELLPHLFKILSAREENSFISRVGKILNMERICDPFTYGDPNQNQEAAMIDQMITATIKQIELAMGCPDDQFRRWELMVENRDVMFNSWSMQDMKGKFKDIPAIVCGGGPSLQSFISAYKEKPELKNCLLIAADAVLHRLLEEGIKPHIVTRCERKHTQIFKGVTKEKTKGIYYAAYPWTPPEFFNLFEDHFYLFRNNGVCLFTHYKHALVDGGVSAANACLEIAFNLGCEKIILTGVDLCFIDNKSHVEGTQVEFNINNSKDKWTKIPTNDGKTATTIPVWQRCLNEYVQAIDKWNSKSGGKSEVINTSEKGAKIIGSNFKNILDIEINNTKDPINLLTELRKKYGEEEKKEFYQQVDKAITSFENIKEGCQISVGLEKEAKTTCDREMDKLMKKLIRSTLGEFQSKDWNPTPDNYWTLIRSIRYNANNFSKLTRNIADSWDTNFKEKYIPDPYYRLAIMDVLQHDVFIYENAVNKLSNATEFDDERFLDYCNVTRDFAEKVEYYANMFLNLMKKAKNV